jgi:hypothetical protein
MEKTQHPKRRDFLFLHFIRTMDKVQKTIGSQYHTPSSEPSGTYPVTAITKQIISYCVFVPNLKSTNKNFSHNFLSAECTYVSRYSINRLI